MTKSDAIVSRVLLWVFVALLLFFATLITARAVFATRLVPRSVEVTIEVLVLVALVAQRVFFRRMKRRADELATRLFKDEAAQAGRSARTMSLFSGGSPRSRIVRLVLWIGWMTGFLIAMIAHGRPGFVADVTAVVCLVGYLAEYLRVRMKDDAKIEPLDLGGRSR